MPVARNIAELRDVLSEGVDARWAERVRISFLKDGAPDPERPVVEIDAVLRVRKAESEDVSGGRTSAWLTTVAGSVGVLSIAWGAYGGPDIRKGDRVKAASRPGAPWFEVLFVDDRNGSRLLAHLGMV